MNLVGLLGLLFREGLRRNAYLPILLVVSIPVAIATVLALIPPVLEDTAKYLPLNQSMSEHSAAMGHAMVYFSLVELRASSGRGAEVLLAIRPAHGIEGMVLGGGLARYLGVARGEKLEICSQAGCLEAKIANFSGRRGEYYSATLLVPRSIMEDYISRLKAKPYVTNATYHVVLGEHVLRALGVASSAIKTSILVLLLYIPSLILSCHIIRYSFRKTLIALLYTGLEPIRLRFISSVLYSLVVFIAFIYGVSIGTLLLHLAFTIAPVIGITLPPSRPVPGFTYFATLPLIYALGFFAYCYFLGGRDWHGGTARGEVVA